MEYVPFGVAFIIFTNILKTGRRTVITIADYHFVLDDQRSHLPALTVGELTPFQCHSQVGHIIFLLFLTRHSNKYVANLKVSYSPTKNVGVKCF